LNKKIILLIFIFGLNTHFSFANGIDFGKIRNFFKFLKSEEMKPELSKNLLQLNFHGNNKYGNNFLKIISSHFTEQEIEKLDLHEINTWRNIIQNLKKIEELNLSKIEMQPNSICYFHNLYKLGHLTHLDLSGNPNIDYLTFCTFNNHTCKKLVFLNLSSINIQLKDLEGISELQALNHLVLINCGLKQDFIDGLSRSKNIVQTLQELNLSNNPEIQYDQNLAFACLKFEKLQKLILMGNSIKKTHQDHAFFLEKLKAKKNHELNIILNGQEEFSDLKKDDDIPVLQHFIPSFIILYLNSGTQNLLESYFSPTYAKIAANSLKTFYVLSLFYLLMKDDGQQSLSPMKITLLYTANLLFLILDLELL